MQGFTEYVLGFYGRDSEIYPEFGVTELQVQLATQVYLSRLEKTGGEFCGDTVDRENVRDIIIEARQGVLPEFKKV